MNIFENLGFSKASKTLTVTVGTLLILGCGFERPWYDYRFVFSSTVLQIIYIWTQ